MNDYMKGYSMDYEMKLMTSQKIKRLEDRIKVLDDRIILMSKALCDLRGIGMIPDEYFYKLKEIADEDKK